MKYKFVKQFDATDCAAACLAMICLYYKKETTISKLRDLMGTDLKGTNLIGLSKAAETLGFTAQSVRVDKDGFLSDFSLPCIANIITKEGMTHFVVVYKITPKTVTVGDPAKAIVKLSFQEFWESFTGVLMLLRPNSDFEPEKIEENALFRRFLRYLTPHKKLFSYSILCSVILTVLGIVSSLFNKIIMDEILPYRLKNMLLPVILFFGVIALVQAVIAFVRQWMLLYLSQKIDIPLLLGYFKHIYKLPMKFFSTRKTGDIITRFNDAFTIKDIFTNIALTLIMDISMALCTGVILCRTNVKLFGIIVLFTAASTGLVFIFKRPYKKINLEQMQQTSVLNSQIIEGLQAVETIKGNALEDTELENIEKEYIKTLRISFKEGFLSNIQESVSSVLQTVGNIALMYFGILQVINGNTTLGSLLAFITLAEFFMDPIGRLVGLQLEIQEAGISMKRLTEIYDQECEPEDTSGESVDVADKDVSIRHVTFRYGNRKPVLKNVSITVPNGKKVAIVGSSGSGKSTLVKLLLKYYEPESGEILIGDTEIGNYDNRSLRRAIAYVPQNIELFSRSIYDNIRVSKTDSGIEDVIEAAQRAHAHDFIKKLPLQYQTYLEEAGNGLSGGEKQRIALARAFLKKSSFYILDESTSNLDFATERAIFDVIYNKLKGKTMLIIAHRLSTIKQCDQIIVMDNGEVVESGTHDELMAQEGQYYRLWEMQQGNFVIDEDPAETIEIPAVTAEGDVITYA